MPTLDFTAILPLINQASRILLVSDGKPDGDSIGSTTAMLTWLLSQHKNVTAFCIEAIPNNLRFLDNVDLITKDIAVFTHPYDLVMTFDASDPVRSGIQANYPNIPNQPPVIVFDHHATNPRYGAINLIDITACSTCELVFRFFQTNQLPINDQVATSLLTGLTTDTSSFSNGGTTSSGIDAASVCLSKGARQRDIVNNLIRNKSLESLKLWGLALSRLSYHPAFDIATTYFTKDDLGTSPAAQEAVEGVSNFLNAYCGHADTILVLKETPDGFVKGSLRSVKRDISKLAQQFGGGGHKKASGFMIKGQIKLKNGHPTIEPAN